MEALGICLLGTAEGRAGMVGPLCGCGAAAEDPHHLGWPGGVSRPGVCEPRVSKAMVPYHMAEVFLKIVLVII